MPWQTNLENISALAADRRRLQHGKTTQPLADATMRSKLHTHINGTQRCRIPFSIGGVTLRLHVKRRGRFPAPVETGY